MYARVRVLVAQLYLTLWARQAPLSMEFSKQTEESESPFPSPGDLPDPGIKSSSPTLQVDFNNGEP